MRCRLVAELFGTFVLVFAGTGAIVFDTANPGKIGHVGIALTFGLVVLAMVYAVGGVSGAHMNPAVTIGLAVAGKFPRQQVPAYCLAQATGAFAASGLLLAMFPNHPTLGATLPFGPWWHALVLEVILTAILVYTVLSIIHAAPPIQALGGVIVGAVIALEALFAGPISGASMNPARSLAPAIMSGRIEYLWVYLVAPLLGSLVAIPTCVGIQSPACCPIKKGVCP